MRVIYIDTLFAINFIVDYLILLATARVGAKTVSRWRIALGAALGAVYAAAAVFPELSFLSGVWFKAAAGILMLLAVFGDRPGILRTGLIFFVISAAFCGVVMAISLLSGKNVMEEGLYLSVSLKVLAISFGICYGILTLVFRGLGKISAGSTMVKVSVEHKGKSTEFSALVDTGNTLRDPLTGGNVLVAEMEALRPLFSKSLQKVLENNRDDNVVEILKNTSETEASFRFHLIPYTAVGVGNSLLLAFRPERVRIAGKYTKDVSIAVSPTRVSDGGIYSALVNGGVV